MPVVTPTPTPTPQMDPKACQVTLQLVPQWVAGGGGGWSSGHASCLRTSGVDSLGAGLATFQVIRSGMVLPVSPPQKKRKKKKKRNHCLSQNASKNATSVLSLRFPVLFWSVLWSLLGSARLAIWEMKDHCTGVYMRLQSTSVSFHMLVTAVPD